MNQKSIIFSDGTEESEENVHYTKRDTSNENRVDKVISRELGFSRNQISTLIENGLVALNGEVIKKASIKLKNGDKIDVSWKDEEKREVVLDSSMKLDIIYEDDDFLIVNKEPNLSVHTASSVKDATLVDYLKANGYSLSNLAGEERNGIVHRLDKVTSGAIIVAKNNISHAKLSEDIKEKLTTRIYLAVIDKPIKHDVNMESYIARNPTNRVKMISYKEEKMAKRGEKVRYAKSSFRKLMMSKDEDMELIAIKLHTGRTHQIRAHLEAMNRHIIFDEVYGFRGKSDIIGTILLHSYIVGTNHPISGERMSFEADMKEYFIDFLKRNFDMEQLNEKISTSYITSKFHNF